MVPKIECPHDQKCPSPNACKTRRYREKRQRDDDSEFERSESCRKAKRETMSRRRAFDKELTQLVIDDSVCLLLTLVSLCPVKKAFLAKRGESLLQRSKRSGSTC